MNKVKGYRNMLNMTQEEISSKLDMSMSTYNQKENGRRAFTDEEKKKFKELLLPLFPNITIDDIFF